MKIVTSWNYCTFVAETPKDENLLRKLNDSIKNTDTMPDFSFDGLEFSVHTYQ